MIIRRRGHHYQDDEDDDDDIMFLCDSLIFACIILENISTSTQRRVLILRNPAPRLRRDFFINNQEVLHYTVAKMLKGILHKIIFWANFIVLIVVKCG